MYTGWYGRWYISRKSTRPADEAIKKLEMRIEHEDVGYAKTEVGRQLWRWKRGGTVLEERGVQDGTARTVIDLAAREGAGLA